LTEKRNQPAYRKYVEQIMSGHDVLSEVIDRSEYVMNDNKFTDRMEEDIKTARSLKVEAGDIVWSEKPRKPLKEVLLPVFKQVGLTVEDLKRHRLVVGEGKMMAIELLYQLPSAAQRDVIPYCGYKRKSSVDKQRSVL
jgi:hypothetical protein